MGVKLTAKIRWGRNLPQKYDGGETYRKNTTRAKLTAKIRWGRFAEVIIAIVAMLTHDWRTQWV